MDRNDIKILLDKYLDGNCSEPEQALLESWYNNDRQQVLSDLTEDQINQDLHLVYSRLPAGKRSILPLWKKLAATAAVVSTITVGAWWVIHHASSNVNDQGVVYTHDVAPAKQGATLTLANGTTVRLSDVQSGQLAQEAGVRISKTKDGVLIYDIASGKSENKINTLSTGRGETYELRLPDGSKVWLNAESRLTYAASAHDGKQRWVKLEGEAYFEVAKDKAHPFVVESNGQQVRVLGTHFNISSYHNQGDIVTTLLEGSVAVSALGSGQQEQLKVGQQSRLDAATGNLKVRQVDPVRATDWKNGVFAFEQETIQSIMRKLERWYDVEVVYESTPEHNSFSGVMSRSETIGQVLRKIALTKKVKFIITGRRITVMK